MAVTLVPNIIANGDTVCARFTFTNKSAAIASGVAVAIVLPAAITMQAGWAASHGVYDGANLWSVGTLNGGITMTLDLCFVVDDVTAIPFDLVGTVSTTNGDLDPTNNIDTISVVTINCADINKCVTIITKTPQELNDDLATLTLDCTNLGAH